MIEYIKLRIKEVRKELNKRNKAHRKEGIILGIAPLSDNGWFDTLKLEGELKILKELDCFTAK